MESFIIMFSSALFIILFIFILFMFIVAIISRFTSSGQYSDFVPQLTVIIPTYNEAGNIANCLDSLFSSNYPEDKLEVIVVDDGSTDNTIDVLSSYNLRLFRQLHLGKSEAVNLGLHNASSDFILTLDADTSVDKNCLLELVKPFNDKSTGATNCAIKVKNKNTLTTMFQNIEYHYNNLIRNSLSRLFKNGVWFFGAVACYRKEAMVRIGRFKKDTLTEDMDTAMELKRAGYKVLNVGEAHAYTIVPDNIRTLFVQRSRWWFGGLQTLFKNKDMFSVKYGIPLLFLFINQFFWSFYAFASFPIIGYQISYWLPYNSGSLASLFMYFFRWFSLTGPISVIYNLPEYGFSYFTFFGVASGILSTIMILMSLNVFKEKLTLKDMLAIFFYFPYTIILNMIIIISLIKYKALKKEAYFIK